MEKTDTYWRNANTPIEEEYGHVEVNKYLWCWDRDSTKAVLWFVKNRSNKKSFKFSAFDKEGRFVANFRNAEVVRPGL